MRSFYASGYSDHLTIKISREFVNLSAGSWQISLVSLYYQLPLYKHNLVVLSNLVQAEYGKAYNTSFLPTLIWLLWHKQLVASAQV